MAKSHRQLDFRSGYWRLNVYVDGELIHSFDDRYGDIYAALKSISPTDKTDYLDELIGDVQQSLEISGNRLLNNEEIELLKSRMLDTDNMGDDPEPDLNNGKELLHNQGSCVFTDYIKEVLPMLPVGCALAGAYSHVIGGNRFQNTGATCAFWVIEVALILSSCILWTITSKKRRK